MNGAVTFGANAIVIHKGIVASGEFATPFGADQKLSLVNVEDIAAAATIMATQPGWTGGCFELMSGDSYTRHEMAALMTEALRKSAGWPAERAVHAVVEDVAGNTAYANTVSMAYDNVPPSTQGLSVAFVTGAADSTTVFVDSGVTGDARTNDSRFTLALHGSPEEGSGLLGYQVQSAGGGWVNITTALGEVNLDGKPTGDYSFRAVVFYVAGNSQASISSVTMRYDVTPPSSAGAVLVGALIDQGLSSSDLIHNDASFTLTNNVQATDANLDSQVLQVQLLPLH